MNHSTNCNAIVKHFEGCKLMAYQCPAKIWTIGYGNTFYEDTTPIKKGDVITQERADKLLQITLTKFAQLVSKELKVELNQTQFDALVSFAFNCGIGNLRVSTLLKKVNTKSSAKEIETEFLKWNKANGVILSGLTRRRKCEAHLFNTGIIKFDF